MSLGARKIGRGRQIGGIALAVLLGMTAPLTLLVEVFLPMMLVLLPSLALVALYHWAGSAAALIGAVTAIASAFVLGGVPFALVCLFALVLPLIALLQSEGRPFFEQMRAVAGAFIGGVLLAVIVLYLRFGGNMIQRLLGQLPQMVRTLPTEALSPMIEYATGAFGIERSAQRFYEMYDRLIGEMITLYQLELPQRILSGALMTGVLCTWLPNWLNARRGVAPALSYVPLGEWALPASITGWLVLLSSLGWIMTLLGGSRAETVFYAIYGIAIVGFGFQALGSFARRLLGTSLSPGGRRGVLIAIGIFGFVWLPDLMLAYGGASAILGSRGVLAQRARDNHGDGEE